MTPARHIPLLPYNTFGIEAVAEHFVAVTDTAQLPEISNYGLPLHVLGGGSNILLTGPVGGLVVHNQLKGITLLRENAEHVWLQVQAGEVWHQLVLHTINHGWGGLENLALIPGTVGAAPIQNIGAYGAEACETIEAVHCWHWAAREWRQYTQAECRFGYRDSIFKQELAGQAFITSVVLRLSKHPVFRTGYGAITQELEAMGVQELSLQAIAQAVVRIRTSKLPDPAVTGNAGSFFKNPTIPTEQYEILKTTYPQLPHYPAAPGMVKVPAAWLIEQCGWKGYRNGNFGVHPHQALVLVNYGGASGSDIWNLSSEIVTSVGEKFGITLEREVQVW